MNNTVFVVMMSETDMEYVPDVCSTFEVAKDFAEDCLVRKGCKIKDMKIEEYEVEKQIGQGTLKHVVYSDNDINVEIMECELR